MHTSLTPQDLRMWLGGLVFLLGMATFVMGVFVLVARAMNRDIQRVAAHTARLAQKGLVEDASGLVGNASALVSALTRLVQTTAGVGIFLIVLGLALMYFPYQYILPLH
ncbi:MAG TPA: hypothetical protein ENJ54_11785 [Chloroflexi bacterium]|nr:hypothetical protein [Chloroflexota bacterium]